MMRNTIADANEITNEIFNKYEHDLRNISFKECLEFAKDCTKDQWLEEAQDFIDADIEAWTLENNDLEVGEDTEEAQVLLVKLLDVEYDKILKHLMKDVTIEYAN
jgi:hypothetical protein